MKNLINWIKKYPSKALLVLLLILLPLSLLVLVGYNVNRNAKSFYFDKDDKDNPILLYQKDITKKKEFNKYFEDFQITIESIDSKVVDDEKIDYANFKFEQTYEPTSSYKNADFNFRYVMTANWFDKQSSTSTRTNIEFPYNLPKRKYLLFKVNKPILYVEINITRHFSELDQTKTVKLYYKYDLNNVKYENVTPDK